MGARVLANALRDRRGGSAAGPLARSVAAASSSRARSVLQLEFDKAAQLVQNGAVMCMAAILWALRGVGWHGLCSQMAGQRPRWRVPRTLILHLSSRPNIE